MAEERAFHLSALKLVDPSARSKASKLTSAQRTSGCRAETKSASAAHSVLLPLPGRPQRVSRQHRAGSVPAADVVAAKRKKEEAQAPKC